MLRGIFFLLLLVVALQSGDAQDTASCSNYDIRLVGGATSNEGRVEICYNGIWGTVCDDFFDDNAAAVVCRQLQFFPEGATAHGSATYGLGVGPITLDDVRCSGSEARLIDCTHRTIRTHNCVHSEDAGVHCLQCHDGDIRLVGGDSSEQGRLEVCFNETWGTVCDDVFDVTDANVACRQLGFTNYTAHFYTDDRYGAGSGPIFLDNVQCTGTEERLVDCPYDSHTADCRHFEDIGLFCDTGSFCSEGDLRLVEGSNNLEGRVEVCLQNSWGTVCDDSWDVQDSAVVCNQLGHSPTGSIAYRLAHFGEGSTLPILMDDVACSGSESRLIDCVYDASTVDCVHNEDAGVQCSPLRCHDGDIRLVGGDSSEQGRLEVCFNETWGTICDDLFDVTDANVACRQLGFTSYTAHFYTDDRYGAGSGPIFLDNVQCTGTEERLIDCPYDSHTTDCRHFEDIGLFCDTGFVCSEGDVRLVGGNNSLEGRVEVCLQNSWGTICDDSWDMQDSAVVCNQLGYSPSNSTAYSNTHFGEGTGDIVMDDVHCVGNETALTLCPHRTDHDCTHNGNAGVRCSPLPLYSPTISTLTRTSATSITLSWEPLSPKQSQGNITAYYVKYRPIERERLNTRNTDDFSIVQSTMDTEITIDDLDPRREYAVSVAANTSAGLGNYGDEQIVGWFDHRNFQLHLMNSAIHCQQWLLDGTTEKLSSIAISLENLCNCEISDQYIADTRLVCSEDTHGSIVFQGRMINTPEHNGTYLLENLQKWVLTGPTVVTKGIQLKVQLCHVTVSDFRDLDCIPLDSTPTMITSSKMPDITPTIDKTPNSFSVVAVAASIGGVLIILIVIIVIIIVFAIIVVRRIKHKQGVVENETNHIYDTIDEFKSTKEKQAELPLLSYNTVVPNMPNQYTATSPPLPVHINEAYGPLPVTASSASATPLPVSLPVPATSASDYISVLVQKPSDLASPLPVPIEEEKGEKQDGTVNDWKEGEEAQVLEMTEMDDYVEMH